MHELAKIYFCVGGIYICNYKVTSHLYLHDIHLHELVRNLSLHGMNLYLHGADNYVAACADNGGICCCQKPLHGNMSHFGQLNTGSMRS